MAVEKVKEFLKEFSNNKDAQELLKQFPAPKSQEEMLHLIVEMGEKLEIRFTEEEAKDAIRELEDELRARTDERSSDLEALDDEEMSEVAGGGKTNSSCSEDYMRTTSCWSDYFCYGIFATAPMGRKDVPCALNYNCFNAWYAEKCEQNYFYDRSLCKDQQD